MTRSISSRLCCRYHPRRRRTATTNAEPCKSYTAHNVISPLSLSLSSLSFHPFCESFVPCRVLCKSFISCQVLSRAGAAYCVAHCGPPSSSSSSSHSAPPARGSPRAGAKLFHVSLVLNLDLFHLLVLFVGCLDSWQRLLDLLQRGLVLEPAILGALDVDQKVQIALGIATLIGIPSPGTLSTWPGRRSLPFGCWMLSWMPLPSKCVRTTLLKPVRASAREILRTARRSAPARSNVSCSASSRVKMMSPGSWSGSWSASPSRTMRSPCRAPRGMYSSRTFLDSTTFLPLHFLQRCFWGSSGQSLGSWSRRRFLGDEAGADLAEDLLCAWKGQYSTNDGRLGLNVPRPLQTPQSWLLEPFLPPEPSHWLQTMFLVLESWVLPLYSSSRVTSYSCSTLRPFLGTLRPAHQACRRSLPCRACPRSRPCRQTFARGCRPCRAARRRPARGQRRTCRGCRRGGACHRRTGSRRPAWPT